MSTYKGIDVSEHQGDIDFNKVKSSGIDFVIIRAGYGKVISQKDKYFEQNYTKAKAAGLKVGAYWYSYADSIEAAQQEANVCIEVLKGKQFDMPIYFDVEEQKQFAKGKDFCSNIVDTFCKKLEAAKYYVGLYSSRSALNSYFSDNIKNRYALWVAEWGSKCNYSGQFGLWQNSSEGKVAGINGNVDTDICYIDYWTTIKTRGFNGYTVNATENTNKTTSKDIDISIKLGNDTYIGKVTKQE